MIFEARELKPYAEPISASDLREGKLYFFLNYEDEDLLIPFLQPVVFIGKNLNTGDVECAYFQDVSSFRRGCRYNVGDNSKSEYYFGSEKELGHVFEFDKALEALLACSIRRKDHQI